MTAFHSDNCKRQLPITPGLTTGYGRNSDNELYCFRCCGESDREYMENHNRVTLYLTTLPGTIRRYGSGLTEFKQFEVGNWPGTMLFRTFDHSHGRHNIAGSRVDVWFLDHTGRRWWGVQYGELTQLCHCRKLKEN